MIVRLSGGLGNQLFQFAAAKSLEYKYGGNVIIDDSYYSNQPSKDTLRKLEVFQFKISFTRKSNHKEQKKIRSKVFLIKLLNRIPGIIKPTVNHNVLRLINVYSESAFLLKDTPKDDDCIIGYFQNYDFLKDSIDEIREQFTLTPEVEKEVQRLNTYHFISSHKNTVAVHIRRGDYVTNANASAYHGLCDMDYYKAAINLITERTSAPRFVFFSDDIDWVRSAFAWVPNAFFSDNDVSLYSAIDMYLMSICKNNIIANSTYSWWGAVLNTDPNKIVICPKRWTLKDDIDQLYVDGWVKI